MESIEVKIDFLSAKTEVLLNPRLSVEQQHYISSLLPCTGALKHHIWVASSGSTAQSLHDHKMVALSKKAILISAEAVNAHLQSNAHDIWVNPLPTFHVGGLGIEARSFLSGAAIYDLHKWNPLEFCALIDSTKATLTSLVPTQVYDLVLQKWRAPQSLRSVIVGGGALNADLYTQAYELGWPLLLSYGLTECASQVATAEVGNPTLKILKHVQVSTDNGLIRIQSSALLTCYAFISHESVHLFDPKVLGVFTTQDYGLLENENLILHGRKDDFIKIGGESVMLSRLEHTFEKYKLELGISIDAALVAVPDERLGYVIHLASTGFGLEHVIEKYNQAVLPFESIRRVHILDSLPRTALNKLKKAELQSVLARK